MGDLREQQTEAMVALEEYTEKLIRGVDSFVTEIKAGHEMNMEEMLNLIVNGLNWTLEVVNRTLYFINEDKVRVNKEEINEGIKELSQALKEGEKGQIADALKNILPSIQLIHTVSKELKERDGKK